MLHICPALLVRVPCPLEVFGWSKGAQWIAIGVALSYRWLCSPAHPSMVPPLTLLPTSFFTCVALVMPFSRDTLLDLSMALTCLSGTNNLRDSLVSQLLGEWAASSPFAKARWYEATEVAQLPVICNKEIEPVKQYASVLLPVPELIWLFMELNVPKGGFWHVSEFTTRRGAAYTAATGLPFPRPIPSHELFMDTWKKLVKPLALD